MPQFSRAVPPFLAQHLRLPVIAAPMFLISNPSLVVAQCLAGVVGSFPALNARPPELLDQWLNEINTKLADAQAAQPQRIIAPFAVNQIIHASNSRLATDMAVCVKHKVPIIISSLSAPNDIVPQVHAYGGIVLHDVISVRHAKKALSAGVDGLIVVCAGAGGHAGTLSPFALVREIRQFYDGLLILSGAIAHGRSILAAQALGADLAYIGTRFIAASESAANDTYKQALIDSSAADIVYTPYFSGVHGNYLSSSIRAAGLDPNNLPQAEGKAMDFAQKSSDIKAWRDIWGAGQGVGQIDSVVDCATIVDQLSAEYQTALAELCQQQAPQT